MCQQKHGVHSLWDILMSTFLFEKPFEVKFTQLILLKLTDIMWCRNSAANSCSKVRHSLPTWRQHTRFSDQFIKRVTADWVKCPLRKRAKSAPHLLDISQLRWTLNCKCVMTCHFVMESVQLMRFLILVTARLPINEQSLNAWCMFYTISFADTEISKL